YDSDGGAAGDEESEAVLLGCAIQAPAAETGPSLVLQQGSDTGVAEDSGLANPSLPSPAKAVEDSGATEDTAIIALAVAMVGCVGVLREQTEEKRIRRRLI